MHQLFYQAFSLVLRQLGPVPSPPTDAGGVSGAPALPSRAATLYLVLAGGYDPRLVENREYFHELTTEATQLGIMDQVRFMPSFSADQKSSLMKACVAVLYTPSNEHFGIVPIEAMAAGRPVIACNSGGPRESVRHGVTGYLCESDPDEFAAAMIRLLSDEAAAAQMGEAARLHACANFSRTAFGASLDATLLSLIS